MHRFHRLLVFVLVVFVILAAGMTVLAAPPSLPAVFYGELELAAYASGSEIVAYVRGAECGSALIRQDPVMGLVYVLDVLADNPDTSWVDGGKSGDAVIFAVRTPWGSTCSLIQSATWEGGGARQVDLSDRCAVVLPLIITR